MSYPNVSYMGEGALMVAFGNRVSSALRARVYSLYSALLERAIPGVTDLVPTYAGLLVKFSSLSDVGAQLAELLLEILQEPVAPTPTGQRHVIPVRYGGEDGPDLPALAEHHGITTAEAIRLHTGRDYGVYFLGFLPGFAYMGRVARKLTTSRLPTPRVRLPAGSVGIAGAQTSVYPFSSPGGWRLVGRTGTRVWDPFRSEPALFAPGDTVRFTSTDYISEDAGPAAPPFQTAHSLFRVHEPGALTTIQDLGRAGYAHLGLSAGGVCDIFSAVRANALVGNRHDAAVLEMTWTGPTLEAMVPATIALEGTDFGCRVDGTLVPPGVGWFVRAGALLKFVQMSPSGAGARAYMAVAGGFDAPQLLRSRSTCLPAGFGGYEGRALRAGDILGLLLPPSAPAHLAGRFWLARPDLALRGRTTLRYVRYGGVASAGPSADRQLSAQSWRISPHSDRIGLRLEALSGEGIALRRREATSFGVVRGAIQLPPGGSPVVLNADHQTTGGYPVAGVVAQADWPVLAQLRPGDEVRFSEISREEALAALSAERATLLAGIGKLGLGGRERDYALV